MPTKPNTIVRLGFAEFKPLKKGTPDQRVLHALNYIAEAVGVLAKAQYDQHGVGRGGAVQS
jgi:hypothetical protein